MMKRLWYTFLYLLVLAGAAGAQNWPQFRGANSSGVATGAAKTPVRWNAAKSENIVWKTAVPGLSHAGPVVWGDKVFVITAEGRDPASRFNVKDRRIGLARDDARHAWRIYSLDKKTGKLKWERAAHEGMPRAKRHVKATQANATPATDGRNHRRAHGDVFVVRAGATYELLATNPMGEPLMATPAISGDLLIVRSQSYVYAIGTK
jgi:outer membrane protein assembly factor BamB